MPSLSNPEQPLERYGRLIIAGLLFYCAACDRPAKRAANDTGAPSDSLRVDTNVAAPVFRAWTAAAGRLLLISSGTADSAAVVLPEFTLDSTLAGADLTPGSEALVPYDLFGPEGSSVRGRLTAVASAQRTGCDGWPVGHLSAVDDVLRPWSVGLRAGVARGIAYTALPALPGRDSAALVIDLSRLASLAPNDTSAALRGLPYVVRSAYLATLADSQRFVMAELVRRVNVEANPFEERITLIGERSLATTDAPYTLLFSERHVGDEEHVPTTELIGLVLRVSDGVHMAFAARDFSDGGLYLMWERNAQGRWRLRWQSAYAGC